VDCEDDNISCVGFNDTMAYDDRDPAIGESVIARRPMRSWATDTMRGTSEEGLTIQGGQMGLVVRRMYVGKTLRLKLLIAGRVALFVCDKKNVRLNWKIVTEIPEA
jgi:hypothetical protein